MNTANVTRKWKIYMIHHTHTDVGYTESQEVIRERQIDYIRQAVCISEAVESGKKPEWEGFHWVCEGFWAVEQFWKQADEEERKRFLHAVEIGTIEMTGNYLNLSELVGEKTLEHFLQKAKAFTAEKKIPMECAMTADINGYSWGYARLLAEAGVKNFYSNTHNHHGMFPVFRKQTPFYWETKTGQRILVWNGEHYHFGNEMGFVPGAACSYMIQDEFDAGPYMENQFEVSETRIYRYLEQLEKENYPYSFVPINASGLISDNAPPNGRIMEFVNHWNREHGQEITIEMTTLSHFFKELRAEESRPGGIQIPVYRGDWPDWWSDGAGSACDFTRVCRQAEYKLQAILEKDSEHKIVSEEELEAIYEKLMLYAEHTFSYSSAMEEPWEDMVKLISQQKHAYAVEANRLCDMAVAKLRKAMGGIILYPGNPMTYKAVNVLDREHEGVYKIAVDSWERDKLNGHFEVLDRKNNCFLPAQIYRTARGAEIYVELILEAKEERILEVLPAGKKSGRTVCCCDLRGVDGVKDLQEGLKEMPVEVGADYLETEQLKICWSVPEGITSWYDKRLGRELLAADREHNAFTPVYEVTPLHGDDDICSVRKHMGRNRKGLGAVRTPGKLVHVKTEVSGAVFTDTAFTYELPGTSLYTMILRVFHASGLAEVIVRIHKDSVWEPENLYITLPFRLEEGALWAEKTAEIFRPGSDQLPGTGTDYYCLQNGYGFLEENAWLAVSMPDTPLLYTGAMEFGCRILNENNPMDKAKLYAWVMNNFWETNFDAENGGFYQFRYRIQSGKGAVDSEELRVKLHDMNDINLCFRANTEEGR